MVVVVSRGAVVVVVSGAAVVVVVSRGAVVVVVSRGALVVVVSGAAMVVVVSRRAPVVVVSPPPASFGGCEAGETVEADDGYSGYDERHQPRDEMTLSAHGAAPPSERMASW